MSIGLNVRYRPPREEEYWPYLTQRHLTEFLWPLAESLGLWRVELMEVISGYTVKTDVAELTEQIELVLRHLDDPATKVTYPSIEHVRERTCELAKRLRDCLTEWDRIEKIDFF